MLVMQVLYQYYLFVFYVFELRNPEEKRREKKKNPRNNMKEKEGIKAYIHCKQVFIFSRN